MGSKTFDGVWFISYADDHSPPHVRGKYSGITVIIDLLGGERVRKSARKDSVRPQNAKRSDVVRILRIAAEHAAALHELWEAMHG